MRVARPRPHYPYSHYPTAVRRVFEHRPRAELLALDWSQPNVALGPVLDLLPHHVCLLRALLRREGHSLPKAERPRPTQARGAPKRYIAAGIGNVPDCVVAMRLGVTRGAVYEMRRRFGIPVPTEAIRAYIKAGVVARASTRKAALAVLAKRIEACARHGLTRDATAKKLRVPIGQVNRAAQLFHVPAAPPRRKDYSHVDWTRPNDKIARLLGIKLESVQCLRSALRRRGYHIPSPPYVLPKRILELRRKYLAAGLGKLPTKVVADKMGVTPWTVGYMRKVMGFPRPGRGRKA